MASGCKDGTVTGDFLDELPNFHIDTFSELEEHSERFAEKKVVFYVGISSVSIRQTKHYMAAWGYEFYLFVLKVSFSTRR